MRSRLFKIPPFAASPSPDERPIKRSPDLLQILELVESTRRGNQHRRAQAMARIHAVTENRRR